MKQYQACFSILVMLFFVSLCFAQATKPGSEISNKFVGTWKLVSIEEMSPNEKGISYPFGRNPRGIIIYGASGEMAVQFMVPDRPKFASDNIDKATPEEAKTAFAGYRAYFGTYKISEREGIVIHHVEGNLFPNVINTDQKRFFEFADDRLILKSQLIVEGEKRTRHFTWERIK
jgi:hypothetical protein